LTARSFGTIVSRAAEVELETNQFRIVEGQYLADILDQPRALESTLENLEIPKALGPVVAGLREGKIKRLVLTGMGASFHALHPLFLRLNQYGYTASEVETSELVYSLQSWLNQDTLIIAVSQSGQSAEIVRLLGENRQREIKHRALILGVTNGTESTLALGSDFTILSTAGKEFSVSCKTYVTALMALHTLGESFCGSDPIRTREELAQTVSAVASYLREWKSHVCEMASELVGVNQLFLLGRGASLAAAGAGALIMKESVRVPAEGMSGAAFRHGPLEMVNPGTFAVVFAGADNTRTLQARLRDDICQAGAKTGWIIDDGCPRAWNLPKTRPGLQHMLEILPVQMMTLALAARLGFEAGRFARISKITTTE